MSMPGEPRETQRREPGPVGQQATIVDTSDEGLPARSYGPNHESVAELVALAEALTDRQVRQLESEVSWRWVPLGLPVGGTIAAARTTAIGAARRAGRGAAVEVAQAAAREAARRSAGGRSASARWSWAETALGATIVGVLGGLVTGMAGQTVVAVLFAMLAIAGGVVLLFVESGYVRRLRLEGAVTAAALALATEDLIEPETRELLIGPWRAVVRD
jgi:hypothetical protein